MTVDDCPAVASAQARAFFDDPLQVWALPDASTRLSILEQVFELLSRYSSVPRGESYTDESLSYRGVLGAARPVRARSRRPPTRWRRCSICSATPNDRFRAAEDVMRAHRPSELHFYLQGLGTDPAAPGRGTRVGRDAAGAHALRRASGIPAYLESTKERNVGFYEGHGFAVVGLRRRSRSAARRSG